MKEGGCSAMTERSLSCVRMDTLGSGRGWDFRSELMNYARVNAFA